MACISAYISAKYQDDVKLVTCLRLFFVNRNDFSMQCMRMSKSHLIAYICILNERYERYVEKKYSEDVLFDIENILETMVTKSQLINENGVFDEMLDILALTILMNDSEKYLSSKQALEKALHDFHFTDDDTGALQLSVADIVYAIHPDLFVHSIQTLVVNLMFSEMKIIQIRSLKLVRQMIVNHAPLVDNILDEIEKRRTTQRLQCLIILCYFIDCEDLRNVFISKSSIWLYLQREVLSTEKSIRKYALYVVRNIIEFQTNDFDDKLLRTSEIAASWKHFFLIQETLDEKQSHLILPVIEHLPKTKNLPMNWYFVLIIQMLRHENTLVLQSVLTYALNIELNVKSISDEDDLTNEFISSVINGLNHTFLYAKSDFPTGDLKHFFKPIANIVFDKFLAINWKPVPMYYIVDSILEHNQRNSEQAAERLIKIFRLVNKIPNVEIRHGIHLNIHRSIGSISGQLSVQNFTQLAQLTYVLKNFELVDFDDWSHEDILTVLDHKDLGDEVKKMFLSKLKITKEDLMSLLKLMKMNHSRNFHIFEVLAVLHFHSLSIWLSDILGQVEDDLVMTLSMYSTLFNISNCQHCGEIVDIISSRLVGALNAILKEPDVINHQHIIQCICELFLTHANDSDISNLLNMLIECGTVQTTLAALTMLEREQKYIDEAKLMEIMMCVKDLENLSVTRKFTEILKLSKVGQDLRIKLYPQLIQMAFNKNNLLAIVVDQFLAERDELLVSSSEHIQSLLTYGIPLKGDQRIEYDLCQLIHRNSNDFQWMECSYVRCKILLKLIYGFPPGQYNRFIKDLGDYLFKLSADLSLSTTRYYANSQVHRTKLRVMQALAAVLCRTNTWDDRLKTSLLTENNQPNVTYILELVIARTIESSYLLTLLEEANSNSSRQSIFVIMYYVCSRLNQLDWAAIYIETILPYCMGQHFNTRLFAQISIVKIIEKFKMNTLNHKYESVYDQIIQSFNKGNAKQISQKFLQDFRFTCIDCSDLLNPAYFLCEIPRVTEMARDELIPLRQLTLNDEIENKLKFEQPFSVNINMCGTHNENSVDCTNENVQKKIIPMKNIHPDANLLETLPSHKAANNEGLIVVATLVSRAANLGGISRTCEIFGVEQLLLNSLKHVENKEFQSLSMTSEKWLSIGEVKSFQLLDYLVSMKSKGYCIIGAEQTANGTELTDFKFPKKTVLLLGHEKDGVPANLLSVLDAAVEIPQFGVVRSLNVHVSGAIFIWEYAKQHQF